MPKPSVIFVYFLFRNLSRPDRTLVAGFDFLRPFFKMFSLVAETYKNTWRGRLNRAKPAMLQRIFRAPNSSVETVSSECCDVPERGVSGIKIN